MQRYRNLIILGLLVLVPLIGAVAVANFLLPGSEANPMRAVSQSNQAEPVRAPITRRVVVAERDLPVGSLLGEEDLGTLDLDEAKIRSSHIVVEGPRTIDSLRGYAMRAPLPPGAPLTWSAVVGPGQRGFLAAALLPGTRAVTIQLSKGTRHAGLIDPGDRVDVILTAKLRLADNTKTVFTRTILEDVRVVAVDRRVETGEGTKKDGKKVKRSEIVTATLEVSPSQADRLALGEHEGTLSVTVRSLAGAARRSLVKAVDLEQLLSSQSEAEATVAAKSKDAKSGTGLTPWKKVRVFRGNQITEEKFADPNRSSTGAPPAE